MLKIRWSHDGLIFNMGIPIPGKDSLYIETGPEMVWEVIQHFGWCNIVNGILFIGIMAKEFGKEKKQTKNKQIIGWSPTLWINRVCKNIHDDVIKWKHFPRYWPFVQGIHRSPVNSPHKGQWRGALMFSLICVRINGWVNNREASDLRCHRAHYDVTVMSMTQCTGGDRARVARVTIVKMAR